MPALGRGLCRQQRSQCTQVGTVDAENAKEHYAGVKQVLQGSKIEILDVRTDETDRVRTQKNVEDTLVKTLRGVPGGPLELQRPRHSKCREKFRPRRHCLIRRRSRNAGGRGNGLIYSTVVHQPYEFGRQVITKMAKYLGGDKSALARGKQIVTTLSIKQDGVADLAPKLKKHLGK